MAKGAATKEKEMTEGTVTEGAEGQGQAEGTGQGQVPAQVTEPGTGAVAGTEPAKKERPKTTYFGVEGGPAMEALDELPESTRAANVNRGRSRVYFELLETVANQGVDNKWRPLAKFGTGTGGRTVANALNRQVAGEIGEGTGLVKEDALREIPEYEGVKWVFDARRVPGENEGEVNSILYAKLVSDEEYGVMRQKAAAEKAAAAEAAKAKQAAA